MAAKKADTEATIQAEIDAAQDERFTFERDIRKQWQDGLTAIDVKIRNATARLGVARAERLKAEARDAEAARTAKATPAAAPVTEQGDPQ